MENPYFQYFCGEVVFRHEAPFDLSSLTRWRQRLFKVWISGQVRRVTRAIRREMRRRVAVEPVIGHLKDDHRMRRNHLKDRDGDRIAAVLAAAGCNPACCSCAGSRNSCASCY
jgi:hypothetical protein